MAGWLLAALALSALFLVWRPGGDGGVASAAAPIRCEPQQRDFARKWVLTGEVAAREAAMITVPAADIWPMTLRWLADDGQMVQAGERVAEFDGTQLLTRVETLESQAKTAANSLSAEASRASAEIATLLLEQAQKKAARDRAVVEARLPAELVPARELAEKKLALERAELELANATGKLEGLREAAQAAIALQQVELDRAQAELAEVHATLERMVVRTPVTGVFIVGEHQREQRPLQAGDGLWVSYRIGKIPSTAGWQVEARLADVDDGRIAVGQEVRAWLDAEPRRELRGRVARIDSVALEVSRTSSRRAFPVLVELDEFAADHPRSLAESLRPGMSVRVEVVEKARSAKVVPRGCVAGWPAERQAAEVLACNAQDCEIAPQEPAAAPRSGP